MANEKRQIDANVLERLRYTHIVQIWDGKVLKSLPLAEAPTVDAVEVVHGRWMPGYPISCSVCGGAAATDYEDANRYEAWITPYCPNCGAKMDGDGNV